MKGSLLSILFFGTIISVFGQHNNEFYIDGAHVTIQSGAILHVQGDVHLDQGPGAQKGRLNNDGLLELRGNFYIRHNNTEQTASPGTLAGESQGVVRFKNMGFADQTTHNVENQGIIVSAGVTDAKGDRAFYDLELQNNNSTLVTASDNYVYIDGGDVEVKNELRFGTDCRIITHNGTPTPTTGENYNHELVISSADATAIVGASVVPGDNNRYIEGKLSRQVSGSATYYFPVGLTPGFKGSDGMAAFELSTVSASTQRINSYVTSDVTSLGVPQLYCDIGEFGSGFNSYWPACVGGPDGIYDFAFLNLESDYEWQVSNTGANFTYDIRVYPGPGLDINTLTGACGSNFDIRFLAKNGAIMSGSSVGPVIEPPHPFSTMQPPMPIGYAVCPPTTTALGNTLSDQTSFSRFRLHGASDNQTLLPVELVSLEANGVDNRFVRIDWETASEVNNDGFELERSTDGINFEFVEWTEGHGTTADPHSYFYHDHDVVPGITYYYRLKQIDFDRSYEYSYVVAALLESDAGSEMVMYPNPVMETNVYLEMNSLKEFDADILILNAIGQEVLKDVLHFSSGFNKRELNTAELSAGTYMVNVYWENSHFSGKLVVLKNK